MDKGISDEGKYSDQRERPRKPFSSAFQYALHGNCIKTFQPGVFVNVSETGVAITTDDALEPGQIIVFRNTEDDLDMKIAVVRWSMRTGERYNTGLMFLS